MRQRSSTSASSCSAAAGHAYKPDFAKLAHAALARALELDAEATAQHGTANDPVDVSTTIKYPPPRLHARACSCSQRRKSVQRTNADTRRAIRRTHAHSRAHAPQQPRMEHTLERRASVPRTQTWHGPSIDFRAGSRTRMPPTVQGSIRHFTVADRVFARTCARTHALRYNQGMLYEKERRLPEAIAVYKEIAVAHPT